MYSARGNVIELRGHERIPVSALATVFWDEVSTGIHYSAGRCLNVSESGMGLQLSEPVARGSHIYVLVENKGFAAFATVRHCSLTGAIGVELREGSPSPVEALVGGR
jgi:hypothetical protein